MLSGCRSIALLSFQWIGSENAAQGVRREPINIIGSLHAFHRFKTLDARRGLSPNGSQTRVGSAYILPICVLAAG